MPVSVCTKATANVSGLRHVKNGVHNGDIFANQDGGSHMTSGIMSVTNHPSGGTTVKAPGTGHFIVMEGQIFFEDRAKPGEITRLEPGDIIRVDKGTDVVWSSPTAGKAFYVTPHEFGIDAKKHTL